MTENQNKGINRLSLKSFTINQVALLIDQAKEYGDNDFQILLLTSYGFIKGDLLENAAEDELLMANQESSNQLTIDLSSLTPMRANLIKGMKEKEPDLEIVDNGATLNLKNVEIYKNDLSNPVLRTNQMIVFANDVISVSLAPRDYLQS